MPQFTANTLFTAVEEGDVDGVKRILKADPTLALSRHCHTGFTALMWAVNEGHANCVQALLPTSDPLAVDRWGRTPLMRAAQWGHQDCIQALLPMSAPLAKDEDERTALMFAAENGHPQCVQTLLSRSDPLAVDKWGNTALIRAAENGRLDCVQALLPVSQIEAVNKKGMTATDIAIDSGETATAELIRAYETARIEARELALITSPAVHKSVEAARKPLSL